MEERLKVILYEPAGQGGICHYTYQLAEALAELGIAVTLFTTENYELKHFKRHFRIYYHMKRSCLKIYLTYLRSYILRRNTEKVESIIDQVGLYRHSPNLSIGLEVFQMLRRWSRRLKELCSFLYSRPHIIHFQWLVLPREDFFFLKILKFLKFKIVYTAHNLLPHNNDSDDTNQSFRNIYQVVDHIIVHAKRNQEELVREFGIDINKTTVIHHGSYDLFTREKNILQEEVRRELHIPNNKKIVLFFGAIRRYKGLDYLVEAFQEVRSQVNDVILLVVGGKPEKNSENDEYYSSITKKLCKYNDIMFVQQYIDVEKVDCYFAAADLVVLPYIKVYQSGVLMLAYASGKPVVVTDVGGLSEIVESGKTGFVVPPSNSSALAEAIIKALVNTPEREAMASRAKYLAETTYSWRNAALKTIALYQCIIETN